MCLCFVYLIVGPVHKYISMPRDATVSISMVCVRVNGAYTLIPQFECSDQAFN